uniref:Uncharacterized protein n=1 Tax=Globisporangium ultimum (strain ATCC 200006 / CBS 805.95 / DAOM BR144) TaxID=431595 RepID=K3X238_GLOUD
MAALAATSLNGVKIYNLASGKTLPQWVAEKTKKALSKDEDYRRRIELLQDFHFASGSQRVKMSGDGNYIVATGMYPPTVKVFDVRDLSMKFERRLDSEVVQLEILSQDFGKLCFLQTDRNLTFHAPYGTHYSLRIPKFGRDMCYHRENCDIYVAASGTDVYRVNLDQGRFLAPLELNAPAANVVKLNPIHQMLGVGCEDGTVECWDTRSQRRVGILDGIVAYAGGVSASSFDEAPVQVTALEFDDDGLTFGVGTSNGHCMLYDLRSSKPLLQKSHQYGLPIIDLKFHDYSKKVVSSDAKVIKIWDKRDGEIFTNVETPSEVRDVCLVEGSQGKSGVLLVAGEQERVMSYYLPELGIAPKWCSFLDSLTEELEEEAQSTVYDDYKFVTRKELLSFGLEHMIGTPLLKAYMHGFFMDARLHAKVKAIAEPFAYDKWRKEKLQAKMEAKQSNRITIQRRLPKVNRAVAERLLSSKDKKSKNKKIGSDDEEEDKEEERAAGDAFANPLGDDRFSRMFTSKDFEVDEDHDTYKLLHPNAAAGNAKKQKKEDMDSDAGTDDEDDAVGGRFDLVSDDDEVEGRPSDESSSEDDDEDDSKQQRPRLGKAQPAAANRKPKFYEIAKGEKVGDLMDFGSSKDRATQKEKKQLAKLPLSERVKLERVREKERSAFKKEETAGGGYMREMSFIPQSDLRKQERQREREAARDGTAATDERRKKRGVGDLKLANPGRNPRFRR